MLVSSHAILIRLTSSAAQPDPQRVDGRADRATTVYRRWVSRWSGWQAEVHDVVLPAFRSQCKYFEPPLSDADARKWWDAAV